MSIAGGTVDTGRMSDERPDPQGKRFDDVPFAEVLAELRDPHTVEDEYWERIWALQRRATPSVFAQSAALLNGPDGLDRRIGANVLGQLGCEGGHPFAHATLPLLSARLGDSADPDALVGIAGAIGHLGHLASREFGAQVLPRLGDLCGHDDEDVRHAVVQAANGLIESTDSASLVAVELLCRLSRDADRDVRDWSTFWLAGLPELEIDLPEVRAALWERVGDDDQEIRVEAINGLAHYHDRSVLPHLLEELTAELVDEDSLQWLDALEAAKTLADWLLLPVLRRLLPMMEEEPWISKCQEAIAACEAARPVA